MKIVFGVCDVEETRKQLIAKGVQMAKMMKSDQAPDEGLRLCDGFDPEGNWFQISNRGITACLTTKP